LTTAFPDATERPRPEAGGPLDEHDTSEVGRVIGKYRLLSVLGEGGMSLVYLAHDEVLDRQVAFKMLHRHLMRDAEARARFAREARAVARMSHRNIPEIYDFSGMGADEKRLGNRAFLVSEYVDGGSLAKLFERAPDLLPEFGVMVALGVARALGCAHGHAIVHRDVKPENVLLGKDGRVRLTDFGIAQVRGLESMTMTGSLIGSPAHMSPEQIEQSKEVDSRADIWGFGTVLYMAVTGGCLPFSAETPHGLLKLIVEGRFDDPRRVSAHVDATLAHIVRRCLEVDRDARFQTIDEVASRLEAWLSARGLTDCERELEAFMRDPAHATEDLRRRLGPALLALGDAALARRDRGMALEHFGRLLALSPDDPMALARIRKLERQHRVQRLRRLAVIGLGVVGLGAAIALARSENAAPVAVLPVAVAGLAPVPVPPRAPTLAPPEAPAGRVFGEALAFELARVDGRLDELREVPPEPRPRRPAEVRPSDVRPARPVPVTLRAFPPAVEIRVAGRTLARGETLSLTPGAYTVTLHHPSCASCLDVEHVITVPAGGPFSRDFTFEQRPRGLEPATLIVRCDEGHYVTDQSGARFACNVRHNLPVASTTPSSLTLSLRDGAGGVVKQRRFTVQPGAEVAWSP
jgi:serine/threonine-protein kinase